MSNLEHTPLHAEHLLLQAKMAPFGQWEMPIQYSTIIEERNHCRTHASLFDTCHMGILRFKGDIAASGIEYAVTNNISRIPHKKCSYGFLLNDNGTVIDDLIIYRIADNELMFVINAATVNGDMEAIRSTLTEKESLQCISPDLAKIDLQGPESAAVLEQVLNTTLSHLTYFSFDTVTFNKIPLTVSRTGYTGELGFELYTRKDHIRSLWRTLLAHDTVQPAGLGARDLLRLEAGLPLSGTDINETITPLEAGLEMFITLDKEFRGKKALIEQKNNGIPRKKIAFKTNSRRAPRTGYPILIDGTEAGAVTSGIFSPIDNCGIGIGLVDRSRITDDLETIEISMGRKTVDATITTLPFYKSGTARKKI